MSYHIDHILHNLIHVDRLLALLGAQSGKVQQSLGDAFASERFVLNAA